PALIPVCPLTASGMGLVPPDHCCFKFFDKRIPKPHVLSIKKTHSKCLSEAFVIKTPRGDYCVRQSEEWAMEEFVKRHN
uniref:Chemokine interleukin-8-like domain-containing protein n=1 Tax=Amphilophus citrinellus TaxID=61819 RepID=A0A3Q0S2Y3_AMPCI